jgi:hypothetical protein
VANSRPTIEQAISSQTEAQTSSTRPSPKQSSKTRAVRVEKIPGTFSKYKTGHCPPKQAAQSDAIRKASKNNELRAPSKPARRPA